MHMRVWEVGRAADNRVGVGGDNRVGVGGGKSRGHKRFHKFIINLKVYAWQEM
jgi:hypothetical protein